jgi:hypothetical protein
MTCKIQFLKNISMSLLGFIVILGVFWLAGAKALPFGERSFHADARQIKPWIILDTKPKNVLISNSRGVYGYDLKNAKFNSDSIYNASLTGISANEVLRLVQHAYYSDAGQGHMFIGIDNICDSYTEKLDGSFFDTDYLTSKPTLTHDFKRIRAILSSPLTLIKRIVFNRPGIDAHGFSSYFPDKNYQTGGVKKSLEVREKADYFLR